LNLEKEPTIFDLETIEEELSNSKDLVNLNNPLRIYLKDIGQVKLLTREEEIELAKTISMARETKDEKVRKLGSEARDRMIVANLRLVVSIAKNYSYDNIPMIDIIQDGTMGLMKAVDRYQVDKGFKFSTYATWWIRQSISRAISNNSRNIRLPVHIYDALSKIRRVKRNYVSEHGVEPNDEIISKISGIPISTVRLINLYSNDTISLDNLVGDGNSTLNDSTQDLSNPDPEECNKIIELEEYVINVLKELNEREQMIIKMRFGIECEEKTLEEIGQYLGVTRERVRQIERRAIEKLKKLIITSKKWF
jgi:RNA polymerase primary sigma factor